MTDAEFVVVSVIARHTITLLFCGGLGIVDTPLAPSIVHSVSDLGRKEPHASTVPSERQLVNSLYADPEEA